nr:unnamed protein product [Digitaria exilis]
MSSSCVSHHHQAVRPRRGGRFPDPGRRPAASASFAPPAPRRRRAVPAAMSAEASPGVEPAEAAPGAAGQQAVLGEMAEEAAVWCAVNGLVVGDRADPRSGTVPGVGLVHAPISLLPARFPASFWKQACELASIFNELVDRVSLDGEFLQSALTKQVDEFTARLLEIHEKMTALNKKEDIRLGLHRSDYMLDSETNSLLQIELNTISSSFPGLGSLVSELHRFLDNKEDISKLRRSFAGLWSLDNEEIVKSAIEKPDLFVLKPQREGGGNNIYGHDLRDTLIKLQKEQESLAAYILMQRIFPKTSLTPLVRGGDWFEDLTISELGIYGAYLRNKDKVILNNHCGYLMRTKVSSSNEGGVAAGFAVLDSIYLTDEHKVS